MHGGTCLFLRYRVSRNFRTGEGAEATRRLAPAESLNLIFHPRQSQTRATAHEQHSAESSCVNSRHRARSGSGVSSIKMVLVAPGSR